MLKKMRLPVAAFVLITTYGSVVRATIMDAVFLDSNYHPLPAETWSFDYDLQVVTLTGSIYDIGREPYYMPPPRSVWVNGHMDSQSVLTVIQSFVNETGVPLTGYELFFGMSPGSHSEIVVGTLQATGSPEVLRESTGGIELAWPEPVPDGGLFTIQFDVDNYLFNEDIFDFSLDLAVVPEPATMTLLGFAGLALLRTRRPVRAQHKNLKVEWSVKHHFSTITRNPTL